jgi:hypothetical protein
MASKRQHHARSPARASKTANVPMVALRLYPQLCAIAWNRKQHQIPATEAFALYERNWRFIDCARLTARERNLINRLRKQYGKGIIHANVSPTAPPTDRQSLG